MASTLYFFVIWYYTSKLSLDSQFASAASGMPDVAQVYLFD